MAQVRGSSSYPDIFGTVTFFRYNEEVMVLADIRGLPQRAGLCGGNFFGFHIHEGAACTGTDFADTGGHFNPDGCEHPYHAGDLPPLLESGGHALMAVKTGRFTIEEILGRTVVIHDHPDDFTTQPSGNSGTKIACGVIRRIRR